MNAPTSLPKLPDDIQKLPVCERRELIGYQGTMLSCMDCKNLAKRDNRNGYKCVKFFITVAAGGFCNYFEEKESV